VEYVVNLMRVDDEPGEWARRREGQGWHLLSVADHFRLTSPFPHVWVSAAAMAAATTTVGITTAFVNNLLRSPVEVAQAALQMQRVSGGRFELGLGAGWAEDEVLGAGLRYPEPRDRAGAFVEATQIVRTLLAGERCELAGSYYAVDIGPLGPVGEPVPLVGSVGGPRTAREITPMCDRVEIKASSATTRGGRLDMAVMAQIDDQHLVDMVAQVRAVDPEIPVGVFGLCNAGSDEMTKQMSALVGDGLYRRFFGPPEHVAEGMAWLAEIGISRVQLSPFDDTSLDRLAPLLLG